MLGEQIMSEANKALVERFVIQWLNKRDGEAFRQICTDDYVAHWRALGDGHGHDEVERMEKLALAAFPDLQVNTEWMISDADLVVQRSRVTGTHEGTWFGVAPTGTACEWTAIEVYRVEGDRIAEQWLSEDWTHVLRQIGGLPPP